MVNHDDEKPQLDLENSERHQSDEGVSATNAVRAARLITF